MSEQYELRLPHRLRRGVAAATFEHKILWKGQSPEKWNQAPRPLGLRLLIQFSFPCSNLSELDSVACLRSVLVAYAEEHQPPEGWLLRMRPWRALQSEERTKH